MVGFDVDDMFPPELMRVTAASDIQRLQAEGEREWSKSATQLEIEARESRAARSPPRGLTISGACRYS